MARSASRRARAALSAFGGLAIAGAAACSSSAPAEIATPLRVATNGRHYTYDQGSVATSSWPKVCSLLTNGSAAAAIGTAVRVKAFHRRCYYIPGNDSFPTLTVTILGIGNDQRNAFDEVRHSNAGLHPRSVGGVGRAAVTYRLTGSPTVNLDVLAAQGLFEIALRSPVGNEIGTAKGQSILARVGRALATEFSG